MAGARRRSGERGAARGWLLALAAVFAALVTALLWALERDGDGGAVVDAADVAAVARPDDTPMAEGATDAERAGLESDAADRLADGIDVRPGVRLAGPGHLTGRVVERGTGLLIGGARVELFTIPPTGKDMLARIYRSAKFAPNWQRKLAPVATVRSAADGVFQFSGVRNGTYFLEARGGRTVPDQAVLVRVDSDGAGGPVDVHVRPGGRVVGHVLDASEKPIRGAKVVVYPGMTSFLTAARDGDFRMFEAVSDSEGMFVVPGLPAGDGYFASASGAGLALSHAGPFSVVLGEDTLVRVTGRRGATVRGKVMARAVDADGGETLTPLQGAHVGALPRGLHDMGLIHEVLTETSATTDAEGNYVMRHVPTGEIDVGVVAQGMRPAKSQPVVATEGGEAEADVVVLESGPLLTLRFSDPAGAPIKDVQISYFVTAFDEIGFEPTFTPLLLQAVEGFEYPKSDADGIAVAGPFAGSAPHTMFCWRTGFEFQEVRWNPATDGDEIDVVLSRGGGAEGIVIDLERAEPITRFEIRSGRLLDWEPDGPTTINPFSGGRWVEDENGRFRIDALGEWGGGLVFSAPGYLPEEVEIPVTPGETTRGIIVKMRPGGTVRGRVLDRDGEPIAGAQVAAMDERGRPVSGRIRNPRGSVNSAKEMMGQEIAMTSLELFSGLGVIGAGFVVSDEDGVYELTALPEGRVAIHASHRDFADGKTELIQIVAGEPMEGVDVTLSTGGGIFGTVRDRYGVPVGGALLLALSTDLMANTDPSARWVRQAASDDEGVFRFEHLEAGGYLLACTRGDEELNLVSFLGTLNFDLVTVPPDTMIRHDLTDSSAAAVRVFGLVTSERVPVGGGGIFALGFESENVLGVDVKIAEVRADGTYEFSGLAPGDYTFTYQPDGPPVRMEVEIPDVPEHRLDLELPDGRVSGVVVDAVTGEPIEGAEALLLPDDAASAGGLIASIVQREGNAARDRTDEDGRFTFPRLQEGHYELLIGPPRWGPRRGTWAPAEPRIIEVIDGVPTDTIEVRLVPALTLTGTVADAAGVPIHRARVFAFSHTGGEVRPTNARTNEEGRFTLKGLAPGRYDVSATAKDFADSAPIEVEVGVEMQEELTLTLTGGVEVRVVVRDALGQPLQGATGRLVPLSETGKIPTPFLGDAFEGVFTGEGVSSPEGVLKLGRYAEGRYRLEVARGSLRAEREPVVLEEGPPLELDVELQ